MGKHRKPSGKGPGPTTKPDPEALPAFDEKALSALTEKIEKGFGKSKAPQQLVDSTGENQAKVKSSKRRLDLHSKAKTKTAKPELNRGTKRDARGDIKTNGKGKAESRESKNKNGAGKDNRDVLLKEILALGGTEEDLDLVAGAASDDEDDDNNTSAPDKSFTKDLAKFVASLGIEGATVEDASEPEEEMDREVEVGEEDWEEASDLEESDASNELEETPKEPTISVPQAKKVDISSKGPNRLIFEARPDWHAAALPELPKPVLNESGHFREVISNLRDYAISLLEEDSTLYASKHLSSSSSHRFLSTIMASGTLSDKVSALTLVVQESPVHTAKSFESLLTLAKKRSRGQAVTALGALKDLLGVGVVLPADRRLRTFASQPGLLGTLEEHPISDWKTGQRLPGNITKSHLVSWAYEDWLKESYFDMLKVLEGWCNDEVVYARTSAVTYVYELLKEKPEQESNLLRLLVNKLGDPDKKISSRTSYLLLQLQTSHPLMKPIVIRSIESELLLRPGQSSHAKYYAINTLNQTILSAREEEVAQKLLNIYFDLFVSLLKKPDVEKISVGPVVNRKGQVQGGGAPMGKKAKAKAAKEDEAKLASEETTEKMISAVLTGVNRAFPFSKNDDQTLEKHMDPLFRITHSSNFNTSIQALMLIEQLATTKHLEVDRFYRTLYESILDPRLVNSSKHTLYLNLLFRALRYDVNIKRVKAFVKRLLQIVTLHQPPFICGVIYLVRELEGTFPGLKALFNDPEEDDEDDEEVFRDVPEYGEQSHAENNEATKSKPPPQIYDGRKRDPEHSNADKTCLWETIPFLVHFHPSVSMFASRLLNDEKMPPKPDLTSHTLTHFLDRFVYRNAKAAAGGPKGGSIMQPLSGGDNKVILLSGRSTGQQPVNSEAFWRKKAEDVAVDEVFFHKYFNQIGKGKAASDKKEKVAKSSKTAEGDEDEEDENEDEIWQALVDSRPEVEGPSDDESDLEMLDLDDSDEASSLSGDEEVDVEAEDDEAAASDSDGGVVLSGFSEDEDVGSEDEVGSELNKLFEKELETAQQPEEQKEETSRQKRRKLKSLPTFASAEDYAEMLDNDEDEDF
ncbi:Ribosome biogenesis NOC1 [Hyphodiscus hymeniophilus]|uniref:Ribosome biogenesis NOC1 n=1 Tax=Hyphodiscus hymeniophilus TaxID=353542 RepID=A0A9P6VLL6_9HELO|nr:Ribosome biogenesis NOC1 [Hyphodiscus hymeniophilus]